ncbi:hypothetical protein [Streptomyces sp. NPDC014764]|uniref:hypothetical protein n=1 Tax=Streptomyces sp. NPDC014764 TaxID=3364907 RepID=UPI0036F72790
MGKLSEQEFEAIVQAVAASVYGQAVERFSVQGFTVAATYRTRSRKGTWVADFIFNEETGHYRYSCPYRSAGSPWTFGDEIGRRIREAVAG